MGHNKGISDKPIRLKIFSPHVLCGPHPLPCMHTLPTLTRLGASAAPLCQVTAGLC